jgi:hypothetical protein
MHVDSFGRRRSMRGRGSGLRKARSLRQRLQQGAGAAAEAAGAGEGAGAGAAGNGLDGLLNAAGGGGNDGDGTAASPDGQKDEESPHDGRHRNFAGGHRHITEEQQAGEGQEESEEEVEEEEAEDEDPKVTLVDKAAAWLQRAWADPVVAAELAPEDLPALLEAAGKVVKLWERMQKERVGHLRMQELSSEVHAQTVAQSLSAFVLRSLLNKHEARPSLTHPAEPVRPSRQQLPASVPCWPASPPPARCSIRLPP